MIQDRNIGFWRIFFASKTEKNLFYLKLAKFLCLGRKCQKRHKMTISQVRCYLNMQAKLILIFQNKII